MVRLFTCGMKAHTPVMYTGSEKSWNGEGQDYDFVIWGGFINTFLHTVYLI